MGESDLQGAVGSCEGLRSSNSRVDLLEKGLSNVVCGPLFVIMNFRGPSHNTHNKMSTHKVPAELPAPLNRPTSTKNNWS